MDVDHAHFVHVENVYESILLQTLDKEVTRGELPLVVRLDRSLELSLTPHTVVTNLLVTPPPSGEGGGQPEEVQPVE